MQTWDKTSFARGAQGAERRARWMLGISAIALGIVGGTPAIAQDTAGGDKTAAQGAADTAAAQNQGSADNGEPVRAGGRPSRPRRAAPTPPS